MKKMFTTYKYYTFALFITVLVSSIVLSPAFKPSYAQSNDFSDTDLWAAVYNDSTYASGGSGVELTEEGSKISSWDILSSKFLLIEPTVPNNDGKEYVVQVKVPKELYFVTNGFTAPTGVSNVEFERNPSFLANNGNSNVNPDKFSGTVTYYIDTDVISTSIFLELAYDSTLWDGLANSPITKANVNPIEVSLCSVSEDGELEIEKEIYVSKVNSGSGKLTGIGQSIKIGEVEDFAGGSTAVSTLYSNEVIFNTRISVANEQRYYEDVYLTYKLPYFTDTNGTKHYMNVDLTKYGTYPLSKNIPIIDTTNLSSGEISINLHDIYYYSDAYGHLIGLNCSFPAELLDLGLSTYTFSNGSVTLKVKNKNDLLTTVGDNALQPISYKTTLDENIQTSNVSRSVLMNNGGNVLALGYFTVSNRGTGNSGAKNIMVTFDESNTGLIKVTTFNVPTNFADQYININYTLVDENNEPVYLDSDGNRVSSDYDGAINEWTYRLKNSKYNPSPTSTSSKGLIFTKFYRGNLPANQRQYYFKTISYQLSTIEAGLYFNHTTSMYSSSAGSTFWGYTVSDTAATVTSRMTISALGFSDKNSVVTTNLVSNNTGMFQTTKSKINNVTNGSAVIKAGDSVDIAFEIEPFGYSYETTSFTEKFVIGLILPNGISVNEDTIKFTNSLGNTVHARMETEVINSSNVLWKIYAPEGLKVGYFNESLSYITNGNNLKFSCTLNTSYYMNNQTVTLFDVVRVGSLNQTFSSTSYGGKTDSYDLNENGSKKDRVGGLASTDKSSFEIVAQNASLEITDSIKKENEIESSKEAKLLSEDELIEYNLKLDCTNGGVLEDFVYFIPIPKKSIGTDIYMVKDKSRFFDTSLQGAATVAGQDYYNILYTVTEGLNYTTAQGTDVLWYTASELESSDYDYSDVTMIKLTSKSPNLEYGSSTTLSLLLKDTESNYDTIAGATDTWSSSGQYKYTLNGRSITQIVSTEGVTVKIGYVHQLSDITLTAAKDMTPLGIGNIKEYTTLSTELPTFEYQHNFKITNVEEYNVFLRNKSYVLDNIDMDGTYANERFAVTVKLNNGSEIDILNSANTTPIDIGESSANNAPTFTYKLYNANALSDDSQERHIIITYEAEDGTKLIQKIFINIESAVAEDPVTSIVTGKRYITFDSTDTSVNISNDSSITAQFITSYIPSSYSSKKFILSESLPAGANIILLDKVGNNNPTYWYYKVTGSETEINLTDFIKMGTDNNKTYTYPTGSTETGESILAIVDFSTCNLVNEDEYKIKLRLVGNGVPDVESDELSIITKNKRTFNLSKDKNEIYYGDDITLTYSMVESLGIETKYSGRKLALVISPQGSLTDDTNIILNGNLLVSNIDGDYIIPLDNVTGTGDNVTLSFDTKILSKISNNVNIDAKLIVSATSDASDPMLGEVVATTSFTLNNKTLKNASLKVTGMNPGRIIKKDELSNEITVNFNYIPDANCNVYVELLEKQGLAYAKVTDKLNKVNGSSTHNQGTFAINANSGFNTVTLKLTNQTQVGTYRLLFSVKDNEGNIVTNVPYNIIIEY